MCYPDSHPHPAAADLKSSGDWPENVRRGWCVLHDFVSTMAAEIRRTQKTRVVKDGEKEKDSRGEEWGPGTGFSIEGEGKGRKAEEGQESEREGERERERENGVIWGDEGDKGGGGETFGRRDKERGIRVLGVQQRCGANVLSVKLLSRSDPAQVGAPLHSLYTTHTHTHA